MNRRCPALFALSLALLAAPACGGSTPAANEAAASRPSDVYTAYLSAVGNAGSIKEVHPFLSALAQKRAAGDLEALKARVPGGRLKILDEQIQGERATVMVSGTLQKQGKELPATGTVQLIREGGGWKVDQESWEAK